MPVLVRSIMLSRSEVTSDFSYNRNYFNTKKIISPKKILSQRKQNKSRYRRASLTIEAALAVPLFLFFAVALWQYFLLVLVQMSVCANVAEVTLETAGMGYFSRVSGQDEITELLYEPLLLQALRKEERIEHLRISLNKTEGVIQAEISYVFCMETGILPEAEISVVQKFCFLPYVGVGGEEEERNDAEDVVYITEKGTVYHEKRSCTYLEIRLEAVSPEEIGRKRNSGGEKYSACELCGKTERSDLNQVYISTSGNRYHSRIDCSSLKRVVKEIKREEAALPPCSKCGKDVEK